MFVNKTISHSYWSKTIVRFNLIGDAWSGLERPGTMEIQRKNVLEYRVGVVPGREPTRPKPNLDLSLHRLGDYPGRVPTVLEYRPSMAAGLHISRKRKQNLYREKLRNFTAVSVSKFKDFNLFYTRLTRTSRQKYYDEKFSEFSSDCKLL